MFSLGEFEARAAGSISRSDTSVVERESEYLTATTSCRGSAGPTTARVQQHDGPKWCSDHTVRMHHHHFCGRTSTAEGMLPPLNVTLVGHRSTTCLVCALLHHPKPAKVVQIPLRFGPNTKLPSFKPQTSARQFGFFGSLTTMSTLMSEVVGHREAHSPAASYAYLAATAISALSAALIVGAALD